MLTTGHRQIFDIVPLCAHRQTYRQTDILTCCRILISSRYACPIVTIMRVFKLARCWQTCTGTWQKITCMFEFSLLLAANWPRQHKPISPNGTYLTELSRNFFHMTLDVIKICPPHLWHSNALSSFSICSWVNVARDLLPITPGSPTIFIRPLKPSQGILFDGYWKTTDLGLLRITTRLPWNFHRILIARVPRSELR